jgi:hypothetical protein
MKSVSSQNDHKQHKPDALAEEKKLEEKKEQEKKE